MADDFFKDKQVEQTETNDVEKIKVGETEFTADELQDLVGAGKRLKDLESRQGQPIDDVMKSWGERGNTIGELKKKVEELESAQTKPQEVQDQEALRRQVIDEAKQYGLLTRDEASQMVNEIYENRRAGEKLLSGVNKVLREAKSDGKPVIEAEKLLEFMADPNNPKDPEKAYKVMFEPELDKWKEERLGTLKKKPMFTENTSTAGAKDFKSPAITRANLPGVLSDFLKSSGEGQ